MNKILVFSIFTSRNGSTKSQYDVEKLVNKISGSFQAQSRPWSDNYS